MIVLGQKDGSIEAQYSLKNSEGGLRYNKTFSDCWYIVTDDTTQTEDDVRAQFVRLGTFWKGAYLKAINPKELNTTRNPQTGVLAYFYQVDLEYDSDFATQDDDQNPDKVNVDDPTDTRPKRRIFTEREEGLLEYDEETGEPIVNVNGESLLVAKDVYSITLEISRFEELIDYGTGILNMANFINQTNASTFYGMGAKIALMKDIQVDEEVITNTSGQKILWGHVTYQINFKLSALGESGHFARPLNEGYKVRPFLRSNDGRSLGIPDTSKPPEIAVDKKTGQPTKVNLALDGTQLADGATPVFLQFNKHGSTDFGPLRLEY